MTAAKHIIMDENEIGVADATIQRLESLYNSYRILRCNSMVANGVDLSEGISLIYENILSIIKGDNIYRIIYKRMGDIFEDYIHNVESDTPIILAILKEYTNNKKTK